MSAKCLLCHSEDLRKRTVTAKPQGTYWVCGQCDYIFRDFSERLAPPAEKVRYEMHENIESPGYRRFLLPVVEVTLKYLDTISHPVGLDYGSGPTPFLSRLFAEKHIELICYDPFFAPDEKVFERTYDFVTSTEVFEHMYEPRRDLNRIVSILKPGGLLVVMTSIPPAEEIFKTWSYRRDETHVGFFSRRSFAYIAREWNFEILDSHENIWVMRKLDQVTPRADH